MDISNITDIRQSEEWSQYLQPYGWVSHRLSWGNIFRTLKLGPVCFGKLQRPVPLDREQLAELEDAAIMKKVSYLKISPGLLQDQKIIQQGGYKRKGGIDLPSRTMLLDLSLSEEELLKALSHTCRGSIVRSGKDRDRVEILQCPGQKQIEDYYKITRIRGRSRNFFVQNLEDQIRKARIFKDRAFIVNVYSSGNKILGTKMFLGFGPVIWYMHAALSREGQKSQSGYLAMWEAMKHFKKLNYRVMDFESLADKRLPAITEGWKGYTDYKLKFGGKIVDFPLPRSKYYGIFSPLNLL